jgi:Protein of unknown function (DUF1425)
MGLSYKKWTEAGLLAGWVVVAGGCAAPAHTDGTASPAQPPPQHESAPDKQPFNGPSVDTAASITPQRPSAGDKRFVIAPELQGVLHVVRVLLDNPPGTYLKIQITVQNTSDAPQHFSYHIDWFNKDGERLPAGAGDFIPWMLMPREVSSIAATAPSPLAADFGIAFIPAVK